MALWRLPRPDFHRLVDTDFQDSPLTLWPARSPSRLATLYTGGSDGFVSSTAAPIASGWSEPSSRAGLSPAVDQCLFTAHALSRFTTTCEITMLLLRTTERNWNALSIRVSET